MFGKQCDKTLCTQHWENIRWCDQIDFVTQVSTDRQDRVQTTRGADAQNDREYGGRATDMETGDGTGMETSTETGAGTGTGTSPETDTETDTEAGTEASVEAGAEAGVEAGAETGPLDNKVDCRRLCRIHSL